MREEDFYTQRHSELFDFENVNVHCHSVLSSWTEGTKSCHIPRACTALADYVTHVDADVLVGNVLLRRP